jgi:two-component system, response regulator
MKISEEAVLWMIDDNPDDLEIGSIVCETMHFPGRFVSFADGAAALARLAEVWGGREQPDVLLLDVNMPRMSGLAVLRAIRRDPRWRHLPVVMFSTSANEAPVARRDGATDYLLKPDMITGALRAIRNVVERFCRRTPDPGSDIQRLAVMGPSGSAADG